MCREEGPMSQFSQNPVFSWNKGLCHVVYVVLVVKEAPRGQEHRVCFKLEVMLIVVNPILYISVFNVVIQCIILSNVIVL